VALKFEILVRSREAGARVGRVSTPHGAFDTPAFMPVGTRGSVKGLLPHLVAATGSQIVLANTYHLLLRPGPELVARRGGLHRFMQWPGPILTDSGGFQVYSLGDISRIGDDGVTFRSVVDGSMVEVTPERSIETQHMLGADIIMAFDDCPPSVDPKSMNQARMRMGETGAAEADERTGGTPIPLGGVGRRRSPTADHGARLDEANERTVRWLERCAKFHRASGRARIQALFGIVQGGTDLARRDWSLERVCAVELPGFAIGGVAVGEGFEEIVAVVRHTAPRLPVDRPRYLMGVGYERDIVAAVRAGVDMFDCVLPTRNGRNANAFTRTGQIRLKNAKYAEDDGPIEEGCDCLACWGAIGSGAVLPSEAIPSPRPGAGATLSPAGRGWEPPARGGGFSRAYIRHLFMAGEMLGPILVSVHNVRHFQRLMLDIRAAVRDDCWARLVERWPVAAEGVSVPPR
jgi:queuine tRNA-ribosyltransferase